MSPPSVDRDALSASFPGGSNVQRWIYRRDLLRELVIRDIKLRYKGSILGQAWTLLNPLAELLVLLFVFTVVLPVDIPHYAASLFTGLLVYGWFRTSLDYATAAIVENREVIRRPGVPASILPVVSVVSTLVHFMLSLPVLFVVLVISGVYPTRAAVILPALIVVQFTLILSLAYPLAALHVWFRDTQYLLRVALQLLFYLTPVFYEANVIPARYQTIYHLNPMVSLVEGYREVLLYGRLPAPAPLILMALVTAGLLGIGVPVFRRTSQRFADELG